MISTYMWNQKTKNKQDKNRLRDSENKWMVARREGGRWQGKIRGTE